MWFVGLVIGITFGAAVGNLLHWGSAWMLFGAIGTVLGALYKSKAQPGEPQPGIDLLERRVAALERLVAELKAQRMPEAAASAAPSASEQPDAQTTRVEAAQPLAVSTASVAEPAPQTPAEAPPVPPSVAQPSQPEVATEPSWLWEKLFGGNILAKVGVLLLFFGIASGMKLVIDYGLFPPSVRLLLGTVAGIAMIAFGFSRMHAPRHRMFGLALQGGGFGVLYIVTYFALAWYGYIAPIAAFAIFALLGIGCLVAAVRFDGEPLAILGLSGAFLAPLLASTGAGSHVVLFSYYTVLDVLVLAVYRMRMWRVVTVTAFVFTLVVGITWALARYDVSAFASTQAFLALFAILFSFAPFWTSLSKRSTDHWAETTLMFGTPVAAALAQTWLNDRSEFGDITLAWCAVIAGLYYTALAGALHMRDGPKRDKFAHAAIAVSLYTLAVPLAFGVQVTSAFWAIEGLALVWVGMNQGRPLAYAAGLFLQVVAGAYFYANWNEARELAVLNGTYVGGVIVAACGAVSAWLSRGEDRERVLDRDLLSTFSGLIGVWALAWWLGANYTEVRYFAAARHEMALHLAITLGTAWAVEAFGASRPWSGPRYAALVLAAGALLLGALEGWHGQYYRHAMHDTMVFSLPLAFATFFALLWRHERDGLAKALWPLHVVGVLVLGFTLLRETLWIAYELAPRVPLWTVLAWQIVPAALLFGIIYVAGRGTWPLSTQHKPYVAVASPVLVIVAFGAALHANFNHAGGGSGLPYIPVASFFDVAQIAVIAAALAWSQAVREYVRGDLLPLVRGLAPALGFVWLSAMAMRLAHHWGHVPFESRALLASGIAQSTLSLLWTALALALMINATRNVLRQQWFVGFLLLAVVGAKFVLVDVVNKGTITWTLSLIGVGLLILAASYFSPAPPRDVKEAQPA